MGILVDQLELGACCHPWTDRDRRCGICMAGCFFCLWKQWLRGWGKGAEGAAVRIKGLGRQAFGVALI